MPHIRDLPPHRVIAVAGLRDQHYGVTYLPMGWMEDSALGFKLVPDEGIPVSVYFVPDLRQAGKGTIRCHATTQRPDPTKDRELATITIPAEMWELPKEKS